MVWGQWIADFGMRNADLGGMGNQSGCGGSNEARMTEPIAFQIVSGGPELIDRIGPLWNCLREHHAAIAPRWAAEMRAKSFDMRKSGLLLKGSGGMLVLIATIDGTDCAYCVGTIDQKGDGEVDSLFVKEACRGRGIGSSLVRRTMQWFADRGTKSVGVDVIAGNDEAVRFYERRGFAPRTVRLISLASQSDGKVQ